MPKSERDHDGQHAGAGRRAGAAPRDVSYGAAPPPATGPWSRTAAALLVLLALVIYLQTIVLVDRGPEHGLFYELHPLFDGVQYYAAAVNLVREGSLHIVVNGQAHPSIYPFGFSTVVALVIPLLREPIAAPFIVNTVASGLLLLVAGLVTRRRNGPLPAAVVVLLTASLPAFIVLGNSPMSETVGALVLFGSVACWLRYAADGARRWGWAAAFLLAASTWFRTGFVFFLPLSLFGTLAPRGLSLHRRAGALIEHGLALTAGMVPLLAVNWLTLGNPLRTGYHYWTGPTVLANIGARPRFAPGNLPGRLDDLWHEALDLELPFNMANLFGNGSYIGSAFLLLLVVAVAASLRRRAWLCIALGSAGYAVMMLCYYRYFGRFFFPLYLISILAVGPLVASVGSMRPSRWRIACAAALVVLTGAAVLGFSRPGASLELPGLWDTGRFERRDAAGYLLARAVADAPGSGPCLVVTDLPTAYVASLVPPDWVVLSLEGERQFSHYDPYRFSLEDRDRQIAEWHASGGCVVVALAGAFAELDSRLPAPEGWRWEVLSTRTHRGKRQFGAARLAPEPAPAPLADRP